MKNGKERGGVVVKSKRCFRTVNREPFATLSKVSVNSSSPYFLLPFTPLHPQTNHPSAHTPPFSSFSILLSPSPSPILIMSQYKNFFEIDYYFFALPTALGISSTKGQHKRRKERCAQSLLIPR